MDLEKLLDAKELLFLQSYFSSGADVITAWRATHPRSTTTKGSNSERATAYNFLYKIKAKLKVSDNFAEFMESMNLGYTRLAAEMEAGLTAMKTEFYKGEPVAEVEDNNVRSKTRSQLIDILGVKSQDININNKDNVLAEELKKIREGDKK